MTKVSPAKIAYRILILSFLGILAFLIIRYSPLSEYLLKKERLRVAQIIKYFPFSRENSLKEWEEKILKGRVVYRIEKGKDLSYVRAKSDKTASALYYKVRLDKDERPAIQWRWRVDGFPKRKFPETIDDTEEEDFAARVYVIFPAAFFTKSKVIEYIWSETLPVGTSGESGYSENIKVLVLRTGKSDSWRSEKRDIEADYVALFGGEPRMDIGAVAFMTDADSTKTSADAVYDEIKIGYMDTEE